jgi:hypothetical protein
MSFSIFIIFFQTKVVRRSWRWFWGWVFFQHPNRHFRSDLLLWEKCFPLLTQFRSTRQKIPLTYRVIDHFSADSLLSGDECLGTDKAQSCIPWEECPSYQIIPESFNRNPLPENSFLRNLILQDSPISSRKLRSAAASHRFLAAKQCHAFLRTKFKCHPCEASWTQRMLIVTCTECPLSKNSLICVDCFLADNYGSYIPYLLYCKSGSCDCCDERFYTLSGTCWHHPWSTANPDLDEIPIAERQRFRAFSFAFSHSSLQSIQI